MNSEEDWEVQGNRTEALRLAVKTAGQVPATTEVGHSTKIRLLAERYYRYITTGTFSETGNDD